MIQFESTNAPTTMNNINPIDLALATCLATFEALLWVINELLGFHAQVTEQVKPHVQPEAAEPALEASQTSQTRSDHDAYWNCYLEASKVQAGPILNIASMTVKELQAFTGIKSSRYNKARLLEIALAQ